MQILYLIAFNSIDDLSVIYDVNTFFSFDFPFSAEEKRKIVIVVDRHCFNFMFYHSVFATDSTTPLV